MGLYMNWGNRIMGTVPVPGIRASLFHFFAFLLRNQILEGYMYLHLSLSFSL
jgi:hypothetical protein